ncbi:hypothetical protein [Faecalibacillus intestinalis]|uniref:hypothetical protein n=1 Tax=Faecalibacillus intestinalis TaxID=1982626 RepID=UPI0022E183CA|nr:hypothetical protein [Faecalibacillus intestinalis]
MLAREECEKACLYLLSHCYETNAPALENGDKDKTYTFTPSGFKESEIFKRLIEEHFNPQPLKFEDLTPGMWVYDAPYEEIVRIKEIESNEWIFLECIKSKDLSNTFFQEGRFYPIQIPNIGTE